jgi:hypothetical protein
MANPIASFGPNRLSDSDRDDEGRGYIGNVAFSECLPVDFQT